MRGSVRRGCTEYVRHRRRRSWLFGAHRNRIRDSADRIGLRLLRQLYRRLPTGALMFKSEYDMRQAGGWDESRQTQTNTICPYCGVGCNLTVHEQDGEIVRVTSPLDHSVTHGNLCIKGRFGWQFVQIK